VRPEARPDGGESGGKTNGTGNRPVAGAGRFLPRFLGLLGLVLLVENALIFIALRFLFHGPRIPQYRLIGAAAQIAAFAAFLLVFKPAPAGLGLDFRAARKRTKVVCGLAAGFILLLVFSSYFIMADAALFALATNIQFGLTTPVLEETVFRGYGWSRFRESGLGPWRTWALTSLLFGLYHFGYWPQVAYATSFHPGAPPMIRIMAVKAATGACMGAVFGLVRWKSGRLCGSVFLHSLLNIMSR
jgi:uncharacterized protein